MGVGRTTQCGADLRATLLVSRRHVTRWGIASRSIAASIGGYGICYAWVAALVIMLPMDPIDATILATCLAFILYVAIILRVFAIHSERRMWTELMATGIAPMAIIWGAG